MNIAEIMGELLPHRYPMLMIDRVVEYEPGVSATCIKCVTANEPWAIGHFPSPRGPVFPEVLMIEAMNQACAPIFIGWSELEGKKGSAIGVDGFRMRREVIPGDVVRIETQFIRAKGGIFRFNAKAYVGEDLAASGEVWLAVA